MKKIKTGSGIVQVAMHVTNSISKGTPRWTARAIGRQSAQILRAAQQVLDADRQKAAPPEDNVFQGMVCSLFKTALDRMPKDLWSDMAILFGGGFRAIGLTQSMMRGIEKALSNTFLLTRLAQGLVSFGAVGGTKEITRFFQRMVEPAVRHMVCGELNGYNAQEIQEAFRAYTAGAVYGMLMNAVAGTAYAALYADNCRLAGEGIKRQEAVCGLVLLADMYKIKSGNYTAVKERMYNPQKINDVTAGKLYYEIYAAMISDDVAVTRMQRQLIQTANKKAV